MRFSLRAESTAECSTASTSSFSFCSATVSSLNSDQGRSYVEARGGNCLRGVEREREKTEEEMRWEREKDEGEGRVRGGLPPLYLSSGYGHGDNNNVLLYFTADSRCFESYSLVCIIAESTMRLFIVYFIYQYTSRKRHSLVELYKIPNRH